MLHDMALRGYWWQTAAQVDVLLKLQMCVLTQKITEKIYLFYEIFYLYGLF
jgi:hypothetical protein